MVDVVLRMKVAAMRRSFTGMHAVGAAVGLLVAWDTLAMGLFADLAPDEAVLPFAAAFGIWALAWVLIPLVFGRDPVRPEYFALLPMPRRTLARAMVAASFVSILAAVTLVATLGLVAYASRLGLAELAVAIIVTPLLLAVLALLSKVVVGLLGEGMKSRIGRELVAMQFAVLLSLMFIGPMASFGDVSQAEEALERLQGWGETVARWAPSGWAPAAVSGAARGEWGLVLVAIGGLVLAGLVLFAIYTRLLDSRLTTRSASGRTPGRLSSAVAGGLARLPRSAVGAVARKEVITWLRDPWRALELRTAIWTAALLTLAAALLGLTEALPFAGIVLALWGVICATNLYGLDGTSLWQVLQAPGGLSADVRGRQVAWLLVFGPLSVLTAIIATLVSGAHDAWPWMGAALPPLLLGGSGLAVAVSVYGMAPLLDPRQRSGAYDSSGDNFLPVLVAMIGTPLLALPAVAVVAAGVALEAEWLRWVGAPAGLLTGLALGWWLGNLATRRLEANGPDMLLRMRSGKSATSSGEPTPEAESADATGEPGSRPAAGWEHVMASMPGVPRAWVQGAAPAVGAILLVPQAIVPAAMKLTDNVEPSWFLALHVSEAWQWPIIALMFALGSGVIGSAAYVYVTYRAKLLTRADRPH